MFEGSPDRESECELIEETFSEMGALRKLRAAMWQGKGKMVQSVLGDAVSGATVRSQMVLPDQAEVRDHEVFVVVA